MSLINAQVKSIRPADKTMPRSRIYRTGKRMQNITIQTENLAKAGPLVGVNVLVSEAKKGSILRQSISTQYRQRIRIAAITPVTFLPLFTSDSWVSVPAYC